MSITSQEIERIIARPAASHLTFPESMAESHYGMMGLNRNTQQQVRQNGVGYLRTYAFHIQDIISFARLVNIRPDESVLDLGTGIGWLLSALRQIQSEQTGYQPGNKPRFVGIDASASLINAAKATEQALPADNRCKGLEFKRDDMVSASSVNGKFNVITGCWVLQHLPINSRRAAFARWTELLAPGGRIVMDFQGNVPISCATDIRYSTTAPPLRAFMVRQVEIDLVQQEYEHLVASTDTGLAFDRGTSFKILGISNHPRALGRKADYDGVGYEDDSHFLEGLMDSFRSMTGRQPTSAEIQFLKGLYFEQLLGKVRAAVGGNPTARSDVKSLALVGVMRVA